MKSGINTIFVWYSPMPMMTDEAKNRHRLIELSVDLLEATSTFIL